MKTHGSLLDAFGRTYLINLPERTDRLRSARKEFARAGWHSVTLFPACRFDSAGGFESIGARGCFHSHLACLTRALEDRSGDVLILEDDIMLPSSLPALTPSILRELRERAWDLAYFGHEQTGDIARAGRWTRAVELIPYDKPVLTAHFYGIRAKMLGPLVAFLNLLLSRPPGHPEGGVMTFDGGLSTFRHSNATVRTLVCSPKLGWQRPSRSDLTPGRIDSVPVLGPIVTLGRGIKQRLTRLIA